MPSCGKIVQRKPERIECTCKTFVKDQYELEIALRFEKKDAERQIMLNVTDAQKNAFKEKNGS